MTFKSYVNQKINVEFRNFSYNKLKGTFKSLGKHNDAINAVLAIACFKGIMRPTFTMMDKDSDPKTKKYAAFREGLTEAIAFCSYIVVHKLVLPLASPLGKYTKAGRAAGPKAIKNGLSLVSVCLTAGLVIPAVCNIVLKPIMTKVEKLVAKKKNLQTPEAPKLDIKENSQVASVSTPTTILPKGGSGNLVQIMQKNYALQNSANMRVGL